MRYTYFKFTNKEYVNNRKKAYYKLYAFRKLRKFLTQGKAKILACSVIENQFF